MSKADTDINSLVKKLEKKYQRPDPIERSPEEAIVHAFLLWEGVTSRANAAMKRIGDTMTDLNELRVTGIGELITLVGKTYPHVEERIERMLLTLDDLYKREHVVSLDRVLSLNKREGRKYLDSLDAIPPYVAARVALYGLGAHAVPIDDRTLDKLIDAQVVEPDATIVRAIAKLERAVKSGEGQRVHELLQAWSEDVDASVRPSNTRSRQTTASGRSSK